MAMMDGIVGYNAVKGVGILFATFSPVGWRHMVTESLMSADISSIAKKQSHPKSY